VAGTDGDACRECRPGREAPPAWVREEQVRVTLDAEKLLEAGEVPLPRVQRALQEIEVGQLVKLVSGFRPAPLIEAVERGRSSHVHGAGGANHVSHLPLPDSLIPTAPARTPPCRSPPSS